MSRRIVYISIYNNIKQLIIKVKMFSSKEIGAIVKKD